AVEVPLCRLRIPGCAVVKLDAFLQLEGDLVRLEAPLGEQRRTEVPDTIRVLHQLQVLVEQQVEAGVAAGAAVAAVAAGAGVFGWIGAARTGAGFVASPAAGLAGSVGLGGALVGAAVPPQATPSTPAPAPTILQRNLRRLVLDAISPSLFRSDDDLAAVPRQRLFHEPAV